MPARQRMVMRAFLQRNSASADSYGHPLPGTWGALATVACWAWVVTETVRQQEEVSMAAARYRAILPLGTDVTESDRVEKIEDRATTEIYGAMVIDAVIRRRTHLELRMRAHA